MSTSKNPPQRRDYKKEDRYENTPEQVKHREERNLLRAHTAAKLGHAPDWVTWLISSPLQVVEVTHWVTLG